MSSSVAAIVDGTKAVVAVESVVPRVRAAITKVVYADTVKLWNLVRIKVSGQVLNVRSGNLRRSIQQQVRESTDQVAGSVFSDASVKYARIHEYGGKINVPEIVPVKAKVLAFQYQGKTVFAMRVKAHTVTMPERSFARSSLAEIAPEFSADMHKAVAEVLP